MQTTRLAIITFLFTLAAAPMWAAAIDLYQISDPYPTFDKSTLAVAGMVAEVEIELDTTAIDRVPEVLNIELPDGRRLTANKLHFEVGRTSLSWSGQIGDPVGGLGYVHLLDRGERVTGIINVGAERFQIVATALGHRLVRVELEDKVCFSEPTDSSYERSEVVPAWRSDSDTVTPTVGRLSLESAWASETATTPFENTKSLTTIDVLAIYPNAFSGSEETGVRQFIEDSISVANGVFATSNVSSRYRLIDSVKLTGPDQPPATGIRGGLEWMTAQQVGNEDVNEIGPQEMLDLRDEYAADMVALFVPLSYDSDNACGIANLPEKDGDLRPYIPGTASHGDFGKRAFTVQRDRCGLNDFTLAHELGHNFGMRHSTDENTDVSVHLFPNGRGHALSATPWQDIANGTLATDVSGNFTVGYHFTPAVDGYVVGLGGLFNGQKTVRLWQDGSGSQLGFASVTGNNNWHYEELLVPIEVQAGTRYTIAVYIGGAGGSIYSNVIPFPRTSGSLTIHGTTVAVGNARPTDTRTDIMYGQADILFVPGDSLASTVMGCVRFAGGDITDEVCHRVPYFSDPNVQVGGLATGTMTRNNAAVARSQSISYAGFGVNNAPVCQSDFMTTPMNTRLSVSLGELLNNDVDPNGDQLSLVGYDIITAQGGSNDTGHTGGFNYTPPNGFSGTDWFYYTVSDRPPGHPAGLDDMCVVYVNVTGNEQVIGEVGSVAGLTHTGRAVLLSRSYSNPVVMAQTLSQNGGDTSVVRITDVQSDRFTLYVDEAPDRDGAHTTETVSYLVVEAGGWQLPSGARLRAGKLQMSSTVGRSVANQWATLSYGGSFSSSPGFFSQVQTNNDPSWVKTRHLSVGTTSAQLALEKDEASAISHGIETVGWIAIESGSGKWNGHSYVAGRTPNAVTDAWYTLSFGTSVGAPQIFAAIRTYDGVDNAALRYASLSSTAVQIRVEEDTTRDSETAHTTEIADYLVLGGSGLLTGIPQ